MSSENELKNLIKSRLEEEFKIKIGEIEFSEDYYNRKVKFTDNFFKGICFR